MSDPSLLPPEMRKREEREHKDAGAKSQGAFHIPEEPIEEPEDATPVTTEAAAPSKKSSRPRAKSAPIKKAKVRVSLMPDEETISFEAEVARRRKIVLITAVSTLVFGIILGAGSVGLVGVREREIEGLNKKLVDLDRRRIEIEDRLGSFLPVVQALGVAPKLLDAHVDPNPLLIELERKTLPSVAYKTITVRADTVVVEVVAPDYLTAARQVKAYQEASGLFLKVAAPSYRETDKQAEDRRTKVEFAVTLTLKPDALKFY